MSQGKRWEQEMDRMDEECLKGAGLICGVYAVFFGLVWWFGTGIVPPSS